MFTGHSSATSILLCDEKNNAVLCSMEHGEFRFQRGTEKELKPIFNADSRDSTNRFCLVFFSIASIYAFAFIRLFSFLLKLPQPVLPIIGAVFFILTTAFPTVSLLTSFFCSVYYPNKEDLHRFRRNHAAEHMVIKYATKADNTWDLNELRKVSRFCKHCGTICNSNKVVVLGIVSVIIGAFPVIQTLAFHQLAQMAACALLLYMLNPLKLTQLFVTEEPTDTELLMAMEGMRLLTEG